MSQRRATDRRSWVFAALLSAAALAVAVAPSASAATSVTGSFSGRIIAVRDVSPTSTYLSALGPNNTIFAMHWNGSTWTTQRRPAVTCKYYCVLVATATADINFGSDDSSAPIIARWDGSRYDPMPRSDSNSMPTGEISAVVGNVAFGFVTYERGQPIGPQGKGQVVEYDWNGSVWQRYNVPAPASSNMDSFDGTWAAGDYSIGCDAQGYGCRYTPLILRRDSAGQWTRMPLPVSTGFIDWAQGGLALGSVSNSGPQFLLKWNGAAWRQLATPPAGLQAISAPTAVGSYALNNRTWRFNGQSFRPVSSYDPVPGDSFLQDAAGRWAWGLVRSNSKVVLLRWNGAAYIRA